MSVYIKGLDLPTGDKAVHIEIHADGTVIKWNYGKNDEIIGEAIPVPPHGRLGDLDDLAERFTPDDHVYPSKIEKSAYDSGRLMIRDFRMAVKDQETIIEEDL